MTENKPTITELAEGSVLLFDKPYGWTSFDVIGKVRSLIRKRLGLKKTKIGHAGTLDPLATGLLIVCTGKLTKTIDSYQAQEKEYTGTFFMGQTTPSYDLETEPDGTFSTNHITPALAKEAAAKLSGITNQIPPQFSAKKIEGTRAYEFARKGEETILEARQVHITLFEINRIELPEIDFRVVCSKGTYIRALARDFGQALHSGAYLKNLRRTRSGELHVDNAWNILDFELHVNQLIPTRPILPENRSGKITD